MKGTGLFGAAFSAVCAALIAPAAATAVPPTFTATLEYGAGGQTSLVATGTITSGSSQYFEVWLSQQTGTPTDIQFESDPAGIDGSCAGGMQNGRGFVQCSPLTPVAPNGTTFTVRFNLPAAYPVDGGAEVTMIAPPGGPANTATIAVSGPVAAGSLPGTSPQLAIENMSFTKGNKDVLADLIPTVDGADWFVIGFFQLGPGDGRAAEASKKKTYDLKPVTVQLQPGVAESLELRVPRKGRRALGRAAEKGAKAKVTITATATSSSGQPVEVSRTRKLKPKK